MERITVTDDTNMDMEPSERMHMYLTGKRSTETSRKDRALKFPIKVRSPVLSPVTEYFSGPSSYWIFLLLELPSLNHYFLICAPIYNSSCMQLNVVITGISSIGLLAASHLLLLTPKSSKRPFCPIFLKTQNLIALIERYVELMNVLAPEPKHLHI